MTSLYLWCSEVATVLVRSEMALCAAAAVANSTRPWDETLKDVWLVVEEKPL